jgi:hypothetical protein
MEEETLFERKQRLLKTKGAKAVDWGDLLSTGGIAKLPLSEVIHPSLICMI